MSRPPSEERGRRSVRHAVLLYLGAATALHLVWEVAQLPLYTIWSTGTTLEILFAVIHCTAGDLLITACALALAALAAGIGHWPFRETHDADGNPVRPWLHRVQ
jgi:hypothetical protein